MKLEWLMHLFLLSQLILACGANPKKTLENIADCGRDTCPDDGVEPRRPVNEYPTFALTLEPFADCTALQRNTTERLESARRRAKMWEEYFRKVSRYQNSQRQSDSAATDGSVSSAQESAAPAATGGETITNTQEAGIDESDFVKAGTKSLFVARGNQIEILDRDSLNLRGTLTFAESRIDGENIFLADDQLVVVTGHPDDRSVRIKIYSKDEGLRGKLPEVVRVLKYAGDLGDLRLSNGHLILVINDHLPIAQHYDPAGEVPPELQRVEQTDSSRVAGIPCDRIIRPSIQDEDWRMTKVISVNILNSASTPHETAFLGSGDHVYMGQDSLYVAKVGFQWSWGYPEDDYETYRQSWETLVITRVDFDKASGAVRPSAIGAVNGRVKDQWAFKEFPDSQGTLAVATSTGHLWAGNARDIAQNHLYLLNADQGALRQIGAIHDFGTGEDIRSVRYVERTAYVVTFKKTDPLFAFDLTDLTHPKQLGELKIPGFSTYMHPVAPGRLIGVGFDADDQGDFAWFGGIKISLFVTKDSKNLGQLDAKILGTRGSSSDATGDHHAFFFDAKNQLVGIPVTEVAGGSGGRMGSEVVFSGAVIYKFAEDRLQEFARITHDDFLPSRCQNSSESTWWETKSRGHNINRIFNIDDRLISVSRFGVKAHAPANPGQILASTRFEPLGSEQLDLLGICQNFSRWDTQD